MRVATTDGGADAPPRDDGFDDLLAALSRMRVRLVLPVRAPAGASSSLDRLCDAIDPPREAPPLRRRLAA